MECIGIYDLKRFIHIAPNITEWYLLKTREVVDVNCLKPTRIVRTIVDLCRAAYSATASLVGMIIHVPPHTNRSNILSISYSYKLISSPRRYSLLAANTASLNGHFTVSHISCLLLAVPSLTGLLLWFWKISRRLVGVFHDLR